ncbi:MAG: Purple acid phosphatase [Myxococcales bacterium]|nr:Purple acid phosphatase [Myxococcales bacterium]
MMSRKFTVLFVTIMSSLGIAACSSGTTTRHLVSVGDEVRIAVGAPATQPNWAALSFADASWANKATAFFENVDGAMPADVTVRRVFDIGADYAKFRTLSLSFDPGAAYDVFLNGQNVGSSDGKSALAINAPAGLLHASGNVLGLAIHAVTAGQVHIAPTLDGEADLTAPPTAAGVVRGPWLIAPATDGVTIVWETDQPVASTAVVDGKSYDGGSGTHHAAQVTGLLPSHAYPYQVEVAGVATEGAELTTAPADTSARVRFVVYGDNRTDGDAHRRVVDAMRNEGADFLINTGDMVASSNDAEWQTFFDIEYSLLARTPMYPSLGNHEENSGGGGRFAELFPLGKADVFKGRVYSFDYGSIHVAVLDSNAWLGDEAKWLDDDLTRADENGARHLFVVMHWGAFSGRKYLQHGSNTDAQKYIAPIARKHKVDALLAGHDHFYERGNSKGLRYFITGGGGAPLADPGKIDETDVTRKIFHFLTVDVVGGVAHVVAKDESGVAFDNVDLTHDW